MGKYQFVGYVYMFVHTVGNKGGRLCLTMHCHKGASSAVFIGVCATTPDLALIRKAFGPTISDRQCAEPEKILVL